MAARESQQTSAAAGFPVCLKWFHEMSAECVCLCLMFTVPKESMAQELLTHPPQSTVAWIQSKDGLTGQLLCLHCRLEGLTHGDLTYASQNQQEGKNTQERKRK